MTPPLVVLGLALVGGYLLWCAVYPYTSCPWCGGSTRRTDGRGNYRPRGRPRGLHRWMHPGGDYRRLGARLIGRG